MIFGIVSLKSLSNLKITDKRHYEANQFTTDAPTFDMVSRSTVQTVQQTVNIPESWAFEVTGTDKNGKVHSKEIYVDMDTYSRARVGDPYVRKA